MLTKLKQVKWGYLLFAVLLFCVGLLFVLKNESLSYVAIAFGILLAVFATVYAVLTLALHERGGAFFFRMLFSILALCCGIATAICHGWTVGILVMLFGFLLIIDGSFKLQTAILAKRFRSAFFWIMLVLSCLVIVGGAVLTKIVFDDPATQAVVLGILLMIDGLGNLASLFFLPWIEKRAKRYVEETSAYAEDFAKLREQEKSLMQKIEDERKAAAVELAAKRKAVAAELRAKKKAAKAEKRAALKKCDDAPEEENVENTPSEDPSV